MRPTRALIASCALAATSAIASAAVVQYTFEVIIFEGPLVDTLWEGEFSYTEDAEGKPVIPLDSLMFNFNGADFSETDDFDYPNYPVAFWQNDVFAGVDFLVANPDGDVPLFSFRIFGDQFFYEPVTRDGDDRGGISFSGDVFYFLVPTPGAASLLGLAALAALRRRRD